MDGTTSSSTQTACSSVTSRSSCQPPIDCSTLLSSLFKACPTAAVFSVVPNFSQHQEESEDNNNELNLPPLLSSLYNKRYRKCSKQELSDIAAHKFSDIQFSKQQAAFLESSTRGQSLSTLWHDYRFGRITASVFGRAAKCKEMIYPTSLVKSVMQYTTPNPAIPALKWGRECENQARDEYKAAMKAKHDRFSVIASGLWLNNDYVYIGATPDGLVSCKCCGEGLLEIKCPFKYKDIDPLSVKDDKFYLASSNSDHFGLQKDHDYFYQVQCQLAVCEKPYCDFVCWTKKACSLKESRETKSFSTQ